MNPQISVRPAIANREASKNDIQWTGDICLESQKSKVKSNTTKVRGNTRQ